MCNTTGMITRNFFIPDSVVFLCIAIARGFLPRWQSAIALAEETGGSIYTSCTKRDMVFQKEFCPGPSRLL